METIKIAIEINVSETTQAFVKKLFTETAKQLVNGLKENECEDDAPKALATKEVVVEEKPITRAPTQKRHATIIQASAQTGVKNAQTASSQASTQAAVATKNIEDVRKALIEKVNDHRDEIKQKLTELGALSVTKLDPAKYDEMFNFLTNLS